MKISLMFAGVVATVAAAAAVRGGDHQCQMRANAAGQEVLGSYVSAIATGELGRSPEGVSGQGARAPLTAARLGSRCIRTGTLDALRD